MGYLPVKPCGACTHFLSSAELVRECSPCRLKWKDTSNCSAVSFRLGGCRRFRLALSLLTVTLEASATTAAAALAAQCSLLDVSCLLRFVLGLCSLLAALMSKTNLRPLLEADALLLTLSYSSMPALDG